MAILLEQIVEEHLGQKSFTIVLSHLEVIDLTPYLPSFSHVNTLGPVSRARRVWLNLKSRNSLFLVHTGVFPFKNNGAVLI